MSCVGYLPSPGRSNPAAAHGMAQGAYEGCRQSMSACREPCSAPHSRHEQTRSRLGGLPSRSTLTASRPSSRACPHTLEAENIVAREPRPRDRMAQFVPKTAMSGIRTPGDVGARRADSQHLIYGFAGDCPLAHEYRGSSRCSHESVAG